MRPTLNLILISLLAFSSSLLFAQREQIIKNEEELIKLYNKIILSEDNQSREEINASFFELLKTTLQLEESFEYPFDNLPTISKMQPEDNSLRVFTWNLQNNEGENDFFGLVQISPKLTRDKKVKVIVLQNQKGELIKSENKSFAANKWPGAVYYQIVTFKKGKQKYYTLAGWRGIDNGLTQKLVDVIYISGETVKFGYPIFKTERKTQRRIVFSYNSKISMHLKFDKKEEQFIFDHLAPSSNLVAGQYRFYGPDGSYDALKLEKKYWLFIPNIDAKNQSKESDIYYTPVTNPEID